MIVLFTDFGLAGPYTGQVKAVLHHQAPGIPVVDLFADAPAGDAMSCAYLLAAYSAWFPPGAVFLAVVDPGVGSERAPLVVEAGEHRFVGPDNGLLEIAMRRAVAARAWRIAWRPPTLSASFHGRDLFAPVAARLAAGTLASEALLPFAPQRHGDWPEDLARIVYIDGFGNAMTGMRAALLPAGARLRVAGLDLDRARTFSDVPHGRAFWYENSNGLAEIAVNGGDAADVLGLEIGSEVEVSVADAR